MILCGPPFTGKTTLGKLAAQQLGWPFRDTDDLLEKCYFEKTEKKLSFREIYRLEGEEIFRLYEKQVVASLSHCQKGVIALGGGCLNNEENVHMLKAIGLIIYIKTPWTILKQRLLSNSLPSYLDDKKDPLKAYQQLVHERSQIYERCADKIIDTTAFTQPQLISMICESYHGK